MAAGTGGGHPDRAPRLSAEESSGFMKNLRAVCRRASECGVWPGIHPHTGSYIEFEDEIAAVIRDVPYETAGLCLDTGYLYYSYMDPDAKAGVEYLKNMGYHI